VDNGGNDGERSRCKRSVRGADVGLFVEDTEREAQVGMWQKTTPLHVKEGSDERNSWNKVLGSERK